MLVQERLQTLQKHPRWGGIVNAALDAMGGSRINGTLPCLNGLTEAVDVLDGLSGDELPAPHLMIIPGEDIDVPWYWARFGWPDLVTPLALVIADAASGSYPLGVVLIGVYLALRFWLMLAMDENIQRLRSRALALRIWCLPRGPSTLSTRDCNPCCGVLGPLWRTLTTTGRRPFAAVHLGTQRLAISGSTLAAACQQLDDMGYPTHAIPVSSWQAMAQRFRWLSYPSSSGVPVPMLVVAGGFWMTPAHRHSVMPIIAWSVAIPSVSTASVVPPVYVTRTTPSVVIAPEFVELNDPWICPLCETRHPRRPVGCEVCGFLVGGGVATATGSLSPSPVTAVPPAPVAPTPASTTVPPAIAPAHASPTAPPPPPPLARGLRPTPTPVLHGMRTVAARLNSSARHAAQVDLVRVLTAATETPAAQLIRVLMRAGHARTVIDPPWICAVCETCSPGGASCVVCGAVRPAGPDPVAMPSIPITRPKPGLAGQCPVCERLRTTEPVCAGCWWTFGDPDSPLLTADQSDLLRAWRRSRATHLGVRVLADILAEPHLRWIASNRPTTITALSRCPGIPTATIKAHGRAVLSLVRPHPLR